MTHLQVLQITRELETMAIINKTHAQGAVTARRVDYRHRKGSVCPLYRVDWYINGNRVTRRDAAKFLAD